MKIVKPNSVFLLLLGVSLVHCKDRAAEQAWKNQLESYQAKSQAEIAQLTQKLDESQTKADKLQVQVSKAIQEFQSRAAKKVELRTAMQKKQKDVLYALLEKYTLNPIVAASVQNDIYQNIQMNARRLIPSLDYNPLNSDLQIVNPARFIFTYKEFASHLIDTKGLTSRSEKEYLDRLDSVFGEGNGQFIIKIRSDELDPHLEVESW